MIYLDTHCAIWAANYTPEFFTVQGWERLCREEVRLSPMVLAELSLLEEIGRIALGPREILTDLTTHYGVRLCERPFEEVVLAFAWLKYTRDPFDRMICAQALAGGGDLLTKDATLLKYFPRAVW